MIDTDARGGSGEEEEKGDTHMEEQTGGGGRRGRYGEGKGDAQAEEGREADTKTGQGLTPWRAPSG